MDTLEYKRQLEINNVELVSVQEKLDSTPEGKLMLVIIAGMNEFYSDNLALEVMKGLKENAYKGKATGGRPPLGFDVGPDGKYIINEQEAGAVRLIFEMYAQGHGYMSIVDELNRRGYKTKRGENFGRNSLHELLRNEKYTGTFTYNRSSGKDKRGKFNRHKYKDDYIRVENGCPRIIDNNLFEKVSKMMEQNRKTGAAHKAKVCYILSGKLYCGLCGHKLVGENRRTRGNNYYYYVCNEAKRKKDCPQR